MDQQILIVHFVKPTRRLRLSNKNDQVKAKAEVETHRAWGKG